jgi:hypothetical protein
VTPWEYKSDQTTNDNIVPQPPSSSSKPPHVESPIVIDAFVHAILFNQESVVETRLKTWRMQGLDILKTNVNRPDMDSKTPLLVAAEKGRLNILVSLLKAGADPTQICPITYRTPLHVASHWGQPSIVLTLLDPTLSTGPSTLNSLDDSSQTPLMLACYNGHLECVKILCSKTFRSDPFIRDESNNTALGLGMHNKVLRANVNSVVYDYMVNDFRRYICDLVFLAFGIRKNLGDVPSNRICSFLIASDEFMKQYSEEGFLKGLNV